MKTLGLLCAVRLRFDNDVWESHARVVTLHKVELILFGQRDFSVAPRSTIHVEIRHPLIGQIESDFTVLSIEKMNTGKGAKLLIGALQLTEPSTIRFERDLGSARPLVVLCNCASTEVRGSIEGCAIHRVASVDEIQTLAALNEIATVVFGPSIAPRSILDTIIYCRTRMDMRSVVIVLYDQFPIESYQDLIDDDLIYYICRSSVQEKDLRATITAALGGYGAGFDAQRQLISDAERDRLTELNLEVSESRNVKASLKLLTTELRALLRAEEIRFFLYDHESNNLYDPSETEEEGDSISPASGLIGYAAQTRESVRTREAPFDPRYEQGIDNPHTLAECHLLACPVSSSDGRTFCVVAFLRRSDRPSFSAEEEHKLQAFLQFLTTSLELLKSRLIVQARDRRRQFFRQESLDYEDGRTHDGAIMFPVPGWLSNAHWLVVVALLFGAIYVFTARVHEIASGPALVRITNRISVPASASGVVAKIRVSPGQRVQTGALLASLQPSPWDGLLERLHEEIRAPAAGIVSDVSVREGQVVNPGEQVLTLVGEGSSDEVFALLPGAYAPQVSTGMMLVVRVDGYPQSRLELVIDDVGKSLLGPADASRYVGKELAESLSLTSPMIVVKATLNRNSFEAAHEQFSFHDGMLAKAEVSVRDERLIVALLPALREVERDHRISFH